jgi:hypothetical protein
MLSNKKRTIAGVLAAALFAAVVAAQATGTMTKVIRIGASSPQREGIAVRGEWRIDVRDRHGKLIRRRVFHNALVGPGIVARFLGHSESVGWWSVELEGSGANQPCQSGGTPVRCSIFETGSPVTAGGSNFKTLTLDIPTSGTDANKLVLKGSAVANRTGSISTVSTSAHACPSSSSPDSCVAGTGGGSYGYLITQHSVSPPIPLAQGQQALVTVKISFSSAP